MDAATNCKICMELLVPLNEIVSIKCGHMFHSACLATWLKEHASCPICMEACVLADLKYCATTIKNPSTKSICATGAVAKTMFTRSATKAGIGISNPQSPTIRFRAANQNNPSPGQAMYRREPLRLGENPQVNLTPTPTNNEVPIIQTQPLDITSLQELIQSIVKVNQESIVNILKENVAQTIRAGVDELRQELAATSVIVDSDHSPPVDSGTSSRENGLPSVGSWSKVDQINRQPARINFLSAPPPPHYWSNQAPNFHANERVRTNELPPRAPPPINFMARDHQLEIGTKYATLIRNWGIAFNGTRQGINVVDFIYRIEALTQQTFGGDFSIICAHLHLLFTGDASK